MADGLHVVSRIAPRVEGYLSGVGLGGGLPFPGIPFVLTIYGQPIGPDADAVKLTAKSFDEFGDPSHTIDGLAAIGDKYVSAYLNELGSANLVTLPIREDLSDADRTFTVGLWLRGLVDGPYVHILDSARQPCLFDIVEVAAPAGKYGAAQALAFDGTNSYTYDISSLNFDPVNGLLTQFVVLVNFRFAAVSGGASVGDTVVSLYSNGNTADFIMFRQRPGAGTTNHDLQACCFLNNAISGAGAVPASQDLDVAGLGVDGWMALECTIGSGGNMTIKCRVDLAGNNTSATATAITNATIDANWTGLIDRICIGARPDGTGLLQNNCRVSRAILVSGVLTDAIWDAVRANNVDGLTQFPVRAQRHVDINGRTPWLTRNRINGQLPVATTGTPTLTSSSVVNTPIDAYWTGLDLPLTATVVATSYYVPFGNEGLWEIMVEPGKDAVDIWLLFGDDPTATLSSPSQKVNGPRMPFGGGGSKISIIATETVHFWIFPLLGDRGP